MDSRGLASVDNHISLYFLTPSMKYEELRNFLMGNGMRMQHVYQPLMIRTLLKSKGLSASVRTVARTFLAQDEELIDYYANITRSMPGNVLRKRGVVKFESNGFRLDVESLNPNQVSELVELCDNRLEEYYESKGGRRKAWYVLKNGRYVPSNIRQEVFERAMGKCEICGISNMIKPLQVDHIRPRSKGGPSRIENYGALCYTCNSQKSNNNDYDYREWKTMYEKRVEGCPFCEVKAKRVAEMEGVFAILDKYPVTKSHTLIVPSRHVSSFFEISAYEQRITFLLLDQVRKSLIEDDRTITGFNVGINIGEAAGQTVSHCHIHLIPRRKGDVTDPRGGVRNTIPGKGDYQV